MLAAPTISVPDSAGRSDIPAISTPQEFSAPPRFPHTRAQLTAIARQYRPLDNYDDDNDDDSSRITSAFVARVATLLDGEREEELKMLLKDTFGSSIDDEDVRLLLSSVTVAVWVDTTLQAFPACFRPDAPSKRRCRRCSISVPYPYSSPNIPSVLASVDPFRTSHGPTGHTQFRP